MTARKITLWVDEDEWYPVWSARPLRADGKEPYGDPIQVDAKTASRWLRVFADFEAVQREISAIATPGKHD